MFVGLLALALAPPSQPVVGDVCLVMLANGKPEEVVGFWKQVELLQAKTPNERRWRIADTARSTEGDQFIKIVTSGPLPGSESEAKRMDYWRRWTLLYQATDDHRVLLVGPSQDPQGCGAKH